MWLHAYLVMLLVCSSHCQREGPDSSWEEPGKVEQLHEDPLNLNIQRSRGLPGTLEATLQRNRPQQRLPILKRSPQGPRFALSLDVPTSILSVLIDLARNQDLHAKAAANAELMARIGRRK